MPTRYGPWTTCYDRFVRWRRDGTWDRLLAHAQTRSDAVGALDWTVSVDATSSRAHQHAAGARKQPAKAEPPGQRGEHDRAERGAGPLPGRVDHLNASWEFMPHG